MATSENLCRIIAAQLHSSFCTKILVNTLSIACVFYAEARTNLHHADTTQVSGCRQTYQCTKVNS